MSALLIQGIQIDEVAPCAGCGASPTPEELKWLAVTYKGIARICSFCGKPVRIVRVRGLKHHHATKKDRTTDWDFEGWDEEPSFSWMTHQSDYEIDLNAHLSCARARCPHADWEGNFEPIVHPDRGVENLEIEKPCKKCGASPDDQDVIKALRRLFEWEYRPCAICGQDFRILRALVAHRWHWGDEHDCKLWSAVTHEMEPFITWCGHMPGEGYRMVDFRAHLRCAQRELPHARWTPPLPRLPWRKQDWSARIEPWERGRIEGEFEPDWGVSAYYRRRDRREE